jgi:hypothetical protein
MRRITCANSVLSTFMLHSGSIKPVSIEISHSEIQIASSRARPKARINIGRATWQPENHW